MRRTFYVAFLLTLFLILLGVLITKPNEGRRHTDKAKPASRNQIDPYPHLPSDISQEKTLVVRQQTFRKSVAMAAAVEKQKQEVAIFVAAVEQARYEEQQRARVAAAVKHYTEEESEEPSRNDVSSEPSSGRCGGDLPPCSVMQRESGGDVRAENPTSSASGKWQFIDSTWNGYGGYSHASDAPESVQDAKARELWAGGSGCGHWSETGAC